MDNNLREVLKFVPPKQHSVFKALISHTKIRVLDKQGQEWSYVTKWDHLIWEAKAKRTWHYCVNDFPQYLSKKMYVYGDIIIFVENKGPNGWMKSKVTILTKDLGCIYHNEKGQKCLN